MNVGAMYLYIVVFRRKDLLTSPLSSSFKRGLGGAFADVSHYSSIKARLSWVGLVAFMWTVGFIIAELIPVNHISSPKNDMSNTVC